MDLLKIMHNLEKDTIILFRHFTSIMQKKKKERHHDIITHILAGPCLMGKNYYIINFLSTTQLAPNPCQGQAQNLYASFVILAQHV